VYGLQNYCNSIQLDIYIGLVLINLISKLRKKKTKLEEEEE